MFQWMPLIPVPISGIKMSSKPSKWLFDMIGGRTTRTELESVFCRWIYFHIRSKIFFWPRFGERGAITPPPPSYGSAAGWRGLSKPVAPPGFCNRGGSEVWIYRGSSVRSPPVPVVLSVYQRGSLLDGLAMYRGICRVIRRSSMTMKVHTYYIIFGRPPIAR